MKFQIAFLSLLTTAAYAQHELKGLRGRGSVEDFDFDFLENNNVTVPDGSTATITSCGSGEQCCVLGDNSHCYDIESSGVMTIGGGGGGSSSCKVTLSSGDTVRGGSGGCFLSCSGTCTAIITAGGAGGGDGDEGNDEGNDEGDYDNTYDMDMDMAEE